MSEIITQKGSEYNQASFIGGMNLLSDDTRLQPNQYRIGFDLTNRYDTVEPVLASVLDQRAPAGIKQEIVTFGDYIILFVEGLAYYRYYTSLDWTQIQGFQMSSTAPRYWTVAVPVSTTNYVRYAASATTSVSTANNPAAGIQLASVLGASAGNLPGLLVQDNINQPQFIFINLQGIPTCRVTQSFTQWFISFTDATNTVVGTPNTPDNTQDNREYVPIGNVMTWVNGILYIASQDDNYIYRSVSGRPLDFVVNVTNILAANTTQQIWTYTDPISGNTTDVQVPPFTQSAGGAFTADNVYNAGGDATTTSYSVGVGGISVLRPLSTGGVFVGASDACFSVTLNQTPNAPTEFGEYTFIRTFLFNDTCLSDRAIIDSIGDTRFIDTSGIRSFNAIESLQNEGRNSVFSAFIQPIFGPDTSPVIQQTNAAASILYNNYELYAINTVLGPCIAKYDTINSCWVAFDFQQVGVRGIKIFAKIELSIQRLFAVTTDNQVYTLYLGSGITNPSFRTIGISSNILWANSNIRMAHPKLELKLKLTRVILNNITSDCTCSFTPYANNRISSEGTITKNIEYQIPEPVSTDPLALQDVNTQLSNLLFSTPDMGQGWKYFGIFSWTGGKITQFSMEHEELTPMNPELSQGIT